MLRNKLQWCFEEIWVKTTQFQAMHLCWRQHSHKREEFWTGESCTKIYLNSQRGAFQTLPPKQKQILEISSNFVWWHRTIPSDVMDVWLKGDVNNLPSHILFPWISGGKFPLFLPLLLQLGINCGQINWDKGAVSLLDIFKMPHFIRIFNHFNSYAWNDHVYGRIP